MTPERWDRVKAIFAEAVELGGADRGRFLASACAEDDDLRHQVTRLLDAHEATTAVVDHPVVDARAFSGLLGDSVAFRTGDLAGGRYRITKLLGQGGMGQVFEAQDEREAGARVALKALRPQFAEDPKLLARFRQEMRLLERVRHPNVCRVLEHAPDAEPVHFVMELLDGETLAERLKREGWLSPAAALHILRQVAQALDAAHAAGIVHRDFKPGNIMLCGDRAVVTDFGVARAERKLDTESALTTTGGYAMGTPAYMAPEQLEGKPATAAADVYALGCVFYEMLTGEQPWAGQTPLAVIARKLREPATPIRSRLPNLEARWEEAIQRCLALAPEDRFARATDVLPLLEGSWRARASTWLRNRKTVVRRVGAVAALAGLAGMGWLGYDAFTRYRPTPAAAAAYELGLQAEEAGSLERSVAHFQRATTEDARHALAHAHLAQALGELDQLDQARDASLRVEGLRRELRLSRADERELEAVRQMILRDFPAAAAQYATLAAESEGVRQRRFRLNQALALEHANRGREALEVLRALPASPRAVALRAVIQSRLRRPDDALWEQATQLAPDDETRASVLFDRVSAAQGRQTPAERRALLDRALALRLSPVLRARGELLLARIETSERQVDNAKRRAQAAAQRALEVGADALAANGKIDLAQAFITQHEYEEAAALLEESLQMAQRNRNRRAEARARLALGSVLVRLNRLEEAQGYEAAALDFYRAGGYRTELVAATTAIADRLIEEATKDRRKLTEVTEFAQQAVDGARALGDLRGEAVALGRLMHVALLDADWPRMLELARRQAEAQRSSGELVDLMQQVYPLWSLGYEAEARRTLDEAVAARKKLKGAQPRLEFREAQLRATIAYQSGDRAALEEWTARSLSYSDTVGGLDTKALLRGLRLVMRPAPLDEDRRALEAALKDKAATRAQALLALLAVAAERHEVAEVRRLWPLARESAKALWQDRLLWAAWLAAREGVAEAAPVANEIWSRMTRRWPDDDRRRYLARPFIRRLRGQ